MEHIYHLILVYVFIKLLIGCIIYYGEIMKRKLRYDRIIITGVVLIIIVLVGFRLLKPTTEMDLMIDLTNKTINDALEFAKEHNLNLVVEEQVNSSEKDKIFKQSIGVDEEIKENDTLIVYVSLGINYEELKVNELGDVPIMMYHGIHNITDNKYTGGNVDKDGYQRTKEAFINDLEFYYNSGYRMIRLEDYINGIIDVEAGYSPIVLTFDDGLENSIKVTGLDENGEIIIDPNSAVGVLEQFKQKYPDFNVTATFFVNGGLFQQSEYNEKILNWLVDHGYDVGNHSYSHADFTTISKEKSAQEIGSLYNLLDKYIPGKYVNIVALPFGSPYNKDHENFSVILNGSYNGKEYETESALRVGWEAESSPFSSSFDKTFLKRIRAYDNNGVEFDIEMNFDILENNRYISDGDKNTITVPKDLEDDINNIYDLDIKTY